MIRLACDSDRLSSLVETPVVLTYSDLIPSIGVLDSLERRFPSSEIGLIDRGLGDPTGQATIANVEARSKTPAEMPGWLAAKTAQGWSCLTVYGKADIIAVVEHTAGVHAHGWWRWFARWGSVLEVPGHPAAMLQFDSDPEAHV